MKTKNSPLRFQEAKLVQRSLIYAWESKTKKYAVYDRLYVNGPYGKISTKKEPIRTMGFLRHKLTVVHGSVLDFCFSSK